MAKEVILIGRGPSWRDCPFDAETWAVLTCYCVPELRDKHFDKVFAFDPPDAEIELGLKIATERGVPIVSVLSYATEQYPTQEVLDKIYSLGYLQNSICHMIAMAILNGYEKIRLYGIDQYRGQYLLQKGAVEFWCGIAIGKGIKLEVSPTSMLLSEYLREVASTIGAGDEEQFASFPDVIPYDSKTPVLAYPMRAEEYKALISSKKLKTTYAFYDLEVAPATYDILSFLVLAEKRRIEHNCDDLRVVIVPGKERFRKGDLEIYQRDGNYNPDYMEWRLRNILVPCCWLIPGCKGVMVCGNRKEAQKLFDYMDGFLYPEGYKVANPVGRFLLGHIQAEQGELPSLQATAQAKVYVSRWLKERADGRKVVTINLRETTYESNRNSNLGEWNKFYSNLDKKEYMPLVIRDMEKAFLPDGFDTYPGIVWNIELRLALYELSYLNLFVNTGPAALALYDKLVNCLVFKWVTPTSGATTEEMFKRNGLEIGSQLRHTTDRQKIVWEDDSVEVITKAFNEMCGKIEMEAEKYG